MKAKEKVNLVIELVLPKLFSIFIFTGLILLFINRPAYEKISKLILTNIITEPNVSAIITISSVFIGFFSTIMTMIASGQTESITRLINTNKVELFIQYAKTALFSSIGIMVFALTITVFIQAILFPYLFAAALYYFLTSSFRFTYICIKMLSFSITLIKEKKIEDDKKRIIDIKRSKKDS